MSSDEKWMGRALALARRGQGWVHPNPMVGAVIVKNDRVIAEGYHHAFGKPHAEVEALQKAGTRAAGATLYVNLEPCAHWGKTPPCAAALVQAKIKRVVAAMKDPNPLVAGRGFSQLRRAGIRVENGVLENQTRYLNRAFIWWVTSGLPYVTLKTATSLDGKSSTVTGESKWITGPLARRRGHQMRAQVDAIAVGIETILKDDPALTTHGLGRNPLRVIFDSRLRLPKHAKILQGGAPVWVMASRRAPVSRRKLLERKGVVIHAVASDSKGRPRIEEALRMLGRRGVTHLLMEGGATLSAALQRAGRVNEVAWFIAPLLIGGNRTLRRAPRLADWEIEKIGGDILLKGRVA